MRGKDLLLDLPRNRPFAPSFVRAGAAEPVPASLCEDEEARAGAHAGPSLALRPRQLIPGCARSLYWDAVTCLVTATAAGEAQALLRLPLSSTVVIF